MSYTRSQILLHWVVFVLIAAQFIGHEPIKQAFDMWMKGGEIAFSPLVAGHVVGGVLVLVLALWRLGLRRKHGVPPLPEGQDKVSRLLAPLTHGMLYALMILMPVSGAVAWFGSHEGAATAHGLMRFALLGFLALHVIGALYHQFVLKDGLMARMKRAR
ncbi:cytochrome b/b6 domain-containing protein [uncultured Lentibacter sp.]|uniref:cytochrome b n=1 Tax=uncultured Lentibacter sp. TaxID=1659309 RepID=UPI00261D8482|nr:cytochrome b/b6 domain-containing protein [uncultured Lentibacter sp.]